jgi:hypothetical protein
MAKQEAGYDYNRYRKLLAEAVDETSRLELIDLLIKENARDRLEAQRTSDRVAMTAQTVARVLGPTGRRDSFKLG